MARFYNLGINLSGLFLVHRRALSLIHLIPHQSLLDLGCGNAIMLQKIREKFGRSVHLFGIDPDPEMIRMGKEKTEGMDISLKIAYGSDLPFINNQFDWVISTLSFHHMPLDEKSKVISEIRRVLKPGGLALISDLGKATGVIGSILQRLLRSHAYSDSNMEAIEEELTKCGLIIEKRADTFGYINHLVIRKAI